MENEIASTWTISFRLQIFLQITSAKVQRVNSKRHAARLLESCSRKAKKQSPVIVAPSCYRGVANPVEANQKKKNKGLEQQSRQMG